MFIIAHSPILHSGQSWKCGEQVDKLDTHLKKIRWYSHRDALINIILFSRVYATGEFIGIQNGNFQEHEWPILQRAYAMKNLLSKDSYR